MRCGSRRGVLETSSLLQVLAGPGRVRPAAGLSRHGDAGGQRALAHLLELGARCHLLGEQRGLDAVEQALQPADELRLGDPQLGVRRDRVLGERAA